MHLEHFQLALSLRPPQHPLRYLFSPESLVILGSILAPRQAFELVPHARYCHHSLFCGHGYPRTTSPSPTFTAAFGLPQLWHNTLRGLFLYFGSARDLHAAAHILLLVLSGLCRPSQDSSTRVPNSDYITPPSHCTLSNSPPPSWVHSHACLSLSSPADPTKGNHRTAQPTRSPRRRHHTGRAARTREYQGDAGGHRGGA